MKNKFLRPENGFLALALLFGVLFAFLVPPNQVPDEDRHFARVYAILNGNLTSQKVDLPVSLYDLMPDYFSMTGHAKKFELNSYFANFSSKAEDTESVEFSPAASYSPILYIPQLLGVGLGKILNLNAHELFVLGRLFSLFLYIGVGYYILKVSPAAKSTLFVLLTMPMNIYIAASYSADTVQLCLTLLYLHMVIVSLVSSSPLTKKEWGSFLLIAALLALTKPVSLLLLLLSLAIPVARFGSLRNLLFFVASQLALGLLTTFVWTKQIATNILPVADKVSPTKQLAFILFNPIAFIQAINASISRDFEFYFNSSVGYFGWLTAPLPDFVYLLFLIVLFLALLSSTKDSFTLTREQKDIFLVVFFLYVIGVFFIMYLYATPLGTETVSGVQGRYFIPVLALLLYITASLNRPRIHAWPWLEKAVIGSLVTLILFLSAFTIYLKFFVVCGEYYFSYDGTCKLPDYLAPERPIGDIIEPVTQTFAAECNDISGIDVLFATYDRRNQSSMNVSLHDETSNTLIFQQNIKLEKIKDNEWLPFRFSAVQNIKDHKFSLTFLPRGSVPGNAVTIWATESDIYPQGDLLGFDDYGDLVFRYVCPYGLLSEIR